MVSPRVLSFLFLLFTLTSQANAKPEYPYSVCITEGGEYAPDSTYQTNLHTVLSRIISDTQIDYGFYNSSYGQDSDRVYATALCRGDVTPHTCLTCLNNSRLLLLKQCPRQKRAVGGYGECMLHYSYRSVLGYYDSDFRVYLRSETNVTDWDQYSYVLKKLLPILKVKAATTDSNLNRKYASGNATGPDSQTVYAAVQCAPDLTEAECNDCLGGAISELPKCCNSRSGGVVIKFRCNFRYENFSFYEPMADTQTLQLSPQGSPSPPSPSPFTTKNSPESTYHGKSSKLQAVIAKCVVPIVVFFGLLIFICIYLGVRKPTKHFQSEAKADKESLLINFDTIRVGTNNFSDANKIGQGGFGRVYKGKLFNEQEVAIKRLCSISGQGDTEFKNEVFLMSRLQHRNLVRLLGFCFEKEERLLVYEFLPNKSLDNFLFDPIKRAHLDWKTRYKIIEGIARGLLYLHEDSQQRIIHRDLKLSNILLDADLNPKISDFGFARLFNVDQTQVKASKIAGTYGYMAPEYARHGKLSTKLDVFSFGVILLEIVSGQKNGGFRNGENVEHLLSFAWTNWRNGRAANIIDPTLNNALGDEIVRCIHIGLLCVQEKVADRPTMASVVLMLDSHSFALPVPLQPAYFMITRCSSVYQFSEFGCLETGSNEQKIDSADASTNEASISSLYPR
ncbi:putative receptor-like protein kinase At4g00960 isoform X1 [Vigna radiata var. radiata]|uniref:Receptor-like protein kinase At4g00960 isoform X1 n=1 Tax=Vigna radiata var. radiata TaxID=3916 RepID=A0A1S3V0T8_VIGRR|nr:putative receptor-like protein kinase At4g00960 isoform X1 [Vigna radiata var. radiata]